MTRPEAAWKAGKFSAIRRMRPGPVGFEPL